MWPLNTGDCLQEVTAGTDLTWQRNRIFYYYSCTNKYSHIFPPQIKFNNIAIEK